MVCCVSALATPAIAGRARLLHPEGPNPQKILFWKKPAKNTTADDLSRSRTTMSPTLQGQTHQVPSEGFEASSEAGEASSALAFLVSGRVACGVACMRSEALFNFLRDRPGDAGAALASAAFLGQRCLPIGSLVIFGSRHRHRLSNQRQPWHACACVFCPTCPWLANYCDSG